MPLQIIKSDIVSMSTDAIVYAETPQPFSLFNFNPLMIHKTGKEILNTREALKPIIIGEAKIAPASLLDCKYIIHTSAPAWHGGGYHELSQLRTCYERVFGLAIEHNCKTIAMPIIASDKLGYPKSLSQKTAIECIREFLLSYPDVEVILVLPGKTGIMLPGNQFTNINMHLNKNYVEVKDEGTDLSDNSQDCSSEDVNDFLEKLTGYMKSRGITERDLCFKANLSPEHLNHILTNTMEAPITTKSEAIAFSKSSVAALAIALELTLEETKDFLTAAGYALTNNSKFDLIMEYCISRNMYDIFDVNQILFRFEQELLG